MCIAKIGILGEVLPLLYNLGETYENQEIFKCVAGGISTRRVVKFLAVSLLANRESFNTLGGHSFR